MLKAEVIREGRRLDEGRVEFALDGTVAAEAAVGRNGAAELRLPQVSPGIHRARARFTGTSRYAQGVAEAVFAR